MAIGNLQNIADNAIDNFGGNYVDSMQDAAGVAAGDTVGMAVAQNRVNFTAAGFSFAKGMADKAGETASSAARWQ